MEFKQKQKTDKELLEGCLKNLILQHDPKLL